MEKHTFKTAEFAALCGVKKTPCCTTTTSTS